MAVATRQSALSPFPHVVTEDGMYFVPFIVRGNGPILEFTVTANAVVGTGIKVMPALRTLGKS